MIEWQHQVAKFGQTSITSMMNEPRQPSPAQPVNSCHKSSSVSHVRVGVRVRLKCLGQTPSIWPVCCSCPNETGQALPIEGRMPRHQACRQTLRSLKVRFWVAEWRSVKWIWIQNFFWLRQSIQNTVPEDVVWSVNSVSEGQIKQNQNNHRHLSLSLVNWDLSLSLVTYLFCLSRIKAVRSLTGHRSKSV